MTLLTHNGSTVDGYDYGGVITHLDGHDYGGVITHEMSSYSPKSDRLDADAHRGIVTV